MALGSERYDQTAAQCCEFFLDAFRLDGYRTESVASHSAMGQRRISTPMLTAPRCPNSVRQGAADSLLFSQSERASMPKARLSAARDSA
jgi:hypothetical protein